MSTIIETLKEHAPELTKKYGVRRLAVFGSVARGEERPDSDVDMLVEFE
ncbi:nucleotidyltransferase domain-containing protein, partial [bacterium]|nr:nucleotidyltransferase domain-containing protein [bacterium]